MESKRGSVLLFGFMLGLTLIILALALAPSLTEIKDNAINNSWVENYTKPDGEFGNITHQGMDCTNDSISNFDKLGCLAADINVFYFIAALILLGGALFGAKFVGG